MTDEARHGALGTIETPSDAVPGLSLMGASCEREG